MWIFITIAVLWSIIAIYISYTNGIKEIENRWNHDYESINDWWERTGRDRWTGEPIEKDKK